jgi:hypothetical protein
MNVNEGNDIVRNYLHHQIELILVLPGFLYDSKFSLLHHATNALLLNLEEFNLH